MLTFDGERKIIEVSGITEVSALELYVQAKQWEDDAETVEYLSPMDAVGMAPLGGGAFTDAIYVVKNGWKLRPSGYSTGTVIAVLGTFITDDTSDPFVPPIDGHPVTWVVKQTTAATVVYGSGGGGATPNQVADAVWQRTGSTFDEPALQMLERTFNTVIDITNQIATPSAIWTMLMRILAPRRHVVTTNEDGTGTETIYEGPSVEESHAILGFDLTDDGTTAERVLTFED